MKLTIVINGCGGVGKDTLCRIAGHRWRVRNISSVTPIKDLARQCGWNGEKTDAARRFLADLKALTSAFNDYPTNWLRREYADFLSSEDEILFVHIREPEEIAKFVRVTDGRARTLLVRGGARMANRAGHYGNHADDDVEHYPYDYYFVNDRPLPETERTFLAFLDGIVRAQPSERDAAR